MSPVERAVEVTEEGIFIPRELLPQELEGLEILVTDDYVILRVSRPGREKVPPDYPFIGIGETRNPTASEDAERILEEEVDARTGWSIDP